MATSPITNINQKEQGEIAISDHTQTGTYYVRRCTKYNNNRVHVEFSAYYTTDLGTVSYGVLPVGFRPKSSITLPAVLCTKNGTCIGATAVIGTSGVITQNFSNECRRMTIDGWFDL